MRILMQARANLLTTVGGDTIQILKTKENLEKLGVDVDLSLNIIEDLSKYDLVHLFNLTRVQETYIQIQNARKQNKKVVLSTIYWPTDELELKGQSPLRNAINRTIGVNNFEKIKNILKYFKGERETPIRELLAMNYFKAQKAIVENSDYFLPNSYLEMKEIDKKFNLKKENYTVVVNAIDGINFDSEDNEFDKYKDSIVCIGRIEPRKNQYKLLKALKNTDYKVLIVGKHAPNHKKYYKRVREIANDNVEFLDHIPNEKIYSLCKVAKVHVLPSWYETPGLVSLEAGVCGCNIVVSDRGTTKDYFKDMVTYCSPEDEISIKKAVETAYNSENNDLLKEYILKNYTWENAAKQTLEGYKNVLGIAK